MFEDAEVNLENAELFADSNRGMYIPQYFAEAIARTTVSNVTDAEYAALEAGPCHEGYWDVWNDVEQKAVITFNGKTWRLHHDGDLWIVPND